jgi:hypothetical protein
MTLSLVEEQGLQTVTLPQSCNLISFSRSRNMHEKTPKLEQTLRGRQTSGSTPGEGQNEKPKNRDRMGHQLTAPVPPSPLAQAGPK